MALPGIDSPLEQKSDLPIEGVNGNWDRRAIPLTVRERVMLDLMAALKNKRDWEKKIFDNDIVGKWTAEALASGDSWRDMLDEDDPQDWFVENLGPASKSRQRVVSEAMFQYVGTINHVRWWCADEDLVCRRVALTSPDLCEERIHGSLRCKRCSLHLRHGRGPRYKDGLAVRCCFP